MEKVKEIFAQLNALFNKAVEKEPALKVIRSKVLWMSVGGLFLLMFLMSIIGNISASNQVNGREMIVGVQAKDVSALLADIENNPKSNPFEVWVADDSQTYLFGKTTAGMVNKLRKNGYWVLVVHEGDDWDSEYFRKTLANAIWVAQVECPNGDCERFITENGHMIAKVVGVDKGVATIAVIESQYKSLTQKGFQLFLTGLEK